MAVFHRLATDDFVRARRYYARINRALERRFVAAIGMVALAIDANPQTGTRHSGAIRWLRPKRFPYTLFFETKASGITVIYAVAHDSRKPGYWGRRRILP